MNDLIFKYNSLSPDFQREVNDFLDFMLSKHQKEKKFDMRGWKEKIKNVSTWSEEDIKVFEEGKQQFNQWKTEKW